MSAAGVTVSTAPVQGGGAGATPSAALRQIQVRPIPIVLARRLLEREHYLHTLPGGTKLCFGAFVGHRLLGGLTFGVGPYLAHSLVAGASRDHCATLTRLWLSDELPANSESRILGITLRLLRRHTALKFLVTYADPAVGHVGTIYQATGWVYTGLSFAMPLYDLGDGRLHHSRSLAHGFGSHSIQHFKQHSIDVKLIPQLPKHRYVYFLNPTWRSRLKVPELPYPKKEDMHEGR